MSFPLAASSIATLRLAAAASGIVTGGLALALLSLATLVIAGLFVRALLGLQRETMVVMPCLSLSTSLGFSPELPASRLVASGRNLG